MLEDITRMREFDVVIYAETETAFTSEGLCGALPAVSGTVCEEAGGDYTVELELAYDAEERWRYVAAGCVLKCWVQTRQADGSVVIGPQLFDVEEVSWGLEGMSCRGRHIFYRLMRNVTTYQPSGAVTLAECVQGILAGCLEPHPFSATIAGTSVAKKVPGWYMVNPVDALLAPDEGALAIFQAGIVRDNFRMIIGRGLGVDRGMSLEAGKNLAGVSLTQDVSELATALMPMGTAADGSTLLLPERYVLSPNAGTGAYLKIYAFDADDASVGEGTTTAQALDRMRAQAMEMLEAGADQPSVTISVDVAQVDAAWGAGLPVALQQAMIEQLEPMPIYDWITLRFQGMTIREQMLRREWDCLRGRLGACELGSTMDGLSSVTLASWQVPSGISGTKLAAGSVPGSAMQPGSVGSSQIGDTAVAQIAASAATIVESAVPGLAWPLGSVYGTTEALADPGDLLGGTWASLGSSMQGGATVYWWERIL